MKQRILSILLCFCLIFSGITVFGASASGGGGGGTSSSGVVKPFIPNYEYFDQEGYYYGFFDQDSLYNNGDYIDAYLNICTPSGIEGSGAEVGLYTKVNGKTYSSLSKLMAAIPLNVPVRVKVEEIQIDEYGYTDGITEIYADTTPVSYYGKTYSPTTGTFQGVSANVADTPVYYCIVDDWDGEVYYDWLYPYLDGNHTYDVDVYDYGIVITNMFAIDKPATLVSIHTTHTPNGKMTSDIRVECYPDYDLTGYAGELYDDSGTKLQSKTGTLDQWGNGIVTFTDLPKEEGIYTIKIWGLSGSSVKTPVYTYDYEKSELEFHEGTVTQIEDESFSDLQIARIYVQRDGEAWETDYYCHLPVEVGDTVCTTVDQLTSVMPIGSYVTVAVGDYSYAFQTGTAQTFYENYGAISEFQLAYDSTEDYVAIRLGLPDGTMGEYAIYSGAKMGDDILDDINEIYDYVKRNDGMPATFNEENGEITHFTVGEGSTDYSDQNYNEYDKSFSDLSTKENKLPVYYNDGYGDEFYEPYLDQNHWYDVTVFEYGIVIREMRAKYMPHTIETISADAHANANLKQNLAFFCNTTYVTEAGSAFVGKLYDENGREVAEAREEHEGTMAQLEFIDLPNTDATYRYSLWLEDGAGSIISNYYEKEISVKALPSGTGTITATREEEGDWDSEVTVLIKIKDDKGTTYETQTTYRFYIDGEGYDDTSEIYELLPVGTKIAYIGDAEGNLVAVNRTDSVFSYGCVVEYGYDIGMPQVTIMDADGSVKKYDMDLDRFLNGHRIGSYSYFDLTMEDNTSGYVAYKTDGTVITELKTNQTSANYAELTYSPSTRKFSSLPDSAKNLPIYYILAGACVPPILDGNHFYEVTLYDYAIEITDMKAQNMDATICYVEASGELNSKFYQDITVALYPVLNKSGAVLKAQLSDDKGYPIAEQTQNAYNGRYQSIIFSNRANQDADYRVKVWVEDADGTRISPVYTKTFSTQEAKVTYGTITDATTGTDEYGYDCLILEITIPGLADPVYVTCPLGAVINGNEILSLEDLQAALPEGSYVKVGESDGYAGNIQIVDSMQTVTNVTLSGTSVSANINMVNKSGETITGTAYTSVYTKAGVLKKTTTTPFSIISGQPNDPVPVNVEGITYQEGDYLKVVCMDENGKPLCNVMKVDIE